MGRGAVARQGRRQGDFLAGKYLLEDCLGVGGMGEVYRATNVSLGRKVAIKILSPEYVNVEDDVLRFLREARAAAAIRHANVVDVIDVARDDHGAPFIVQELLAGEDLERHLKSRGGRLPFTEALEIMIPVADAVAAAHAQRVVHRDLKPANIFLARDHGRVTPKVLDFGACLFPTIAERSAKDLRMLIGTPHYMAPEQIVSKAEVDARSDVWALGVILYELLVGETPFEAETPDAVMQLVKTREVPPLRSKMKNAPVELEELIATCTKRDRLARFSDASLVHARMVGLQQRLIPGGSAEAWAPAPPSPRARPAPASAKTPARPRLNTLSSPDEEPPKARDSLDLDFPFPGEPLAPLPLPLPPPPEPPPAAREERGDERPIPSSLPPILDPRGAATPSSLPPILDPRAAGPEVVAPDPPPIPRELREPTPPPTSAPTSDPNRPPAVFATPNDTLRQERPRWSAGNVLKLALAVLVPAAAGLAVVRVVPAIGVPLGHALRGDSVLASGVLAVVALAAAGALGVRAYTAEERDRWDTISAGAAVLFAIAMIIVTFSASDAATTATPSSMAGLSTAVAPLAPLAVALGMFARARAAWLDPYANGEARRYAALASLALLAALVLSPIGAVRTPTTMPRSIPAAFGR